VILKDNARMSPELLQKLTSAMDKLPAFPKSVQTILTMTQDINCAPKELVEVIDKDPVVTVKILKVVNSAYFGLPKSISSVGHAVAFLGFNSIKNLALSVAVVGVMPKENSAGFNANAYLLHSLATAVIAKRLAISRDIADPVDCYTAGLLHDFGKVVCAQLMPDVVEQALAESRSQGQSLHVLLRASIGTDHATIGAMLAKRWQFAANLVDVIGQQHESGTSDSGLFACVFAANQISKRLNYGDGGNNCIYALPSAAAGTLGGTLEEVIESFDNLDTALEEARLFANL